MEQAEQKTIFNWNKTDCSKSTVFEPKTIDDLKTILKMARSKKTPVRVVGPSRHTWGGLSMSEGYLIDTRHFNKILSIDPDARTAKAEAGVILRTFNRELEKHGLALANIGGIDAQCIAGVASTGTHGSSLQHGTISDEVISLEVLTADGKVITVESGHPDFSAFQTSLGAMGIIISVTFMCVKHFYLVYETKRAPKTWRNLSLDEIKKLLEENYFFQIAIQPFTETVLFSSKNKIEMGAASAFLLRFVKSPWNLLKETLGVYAVEYIALPLTRRFPSLIKPFLNFSFNLLEEKSTDTARRALTLGNNDAKGLYVNKTFQDQEYAVDIEKTIMAVNKVLDTIQKYDRQGRTAPISLGIRFVAKSGAYINTASKRDTCYIDVLLFDVPFSKWKGLIEEIETALYPLGARPHWGKNNFLTYEKIKKWNLYPEIEKFREAKATYDPENIFSNEYLETRFELSKLQSNSKNFS